MRGTSALIEGAGKTAAPLALAGSIVAPVSAIGAALGGLAASAAGSGIARHFGASPYVERLAGDVGAIPGAMLGGKATGVVGRAAVPLARSALGLPTDASAQATLEHTSGIRPATINKQARSLVDAAGTRRGIAIAKSVSKPSLTPALSSLITKRTV